MIAAEQTLDESKRSHATPFGVDEASISLMKRALEVRPFSDDVLTQTPARDISLKVAEVVATLRRLSLNEVFARQGVLDRLTGADLEARLHFEIGVQDVSKQITALVTMSENAMRIVASLRQAHSQLRKQQAYLSRMIPAAKRALADGKDVDENVKLRFERQLSNLLTLQTANEATLVQTSMAEKNLISLTDRVHEVANSLFALWQRNALAIAQSPGRLKPNDPRAQAFLSLYDQLLAKLH